MPTANEDYLDAALRHEIELRRYSVNLLRRISNILAQADRDLSELLTNRLDRFTGSPDLDYTSERWTELLKDIQTARAVAVGEVRKLVRSELASLAVIEGAHEVAALTTSLPFSYSFAAVSATQLRAIVTARPFHGKLLGDWFKTLELQERARLTQAIQLGMVQGETTPQIVRRLVGTKANNYADGILAISRRDATAITRTAVNHVANTAHNYVWEANSDVVRAKVWHSMLDGRTTAVCRARDGKVAPVGDNPLPPGAEPLKPPNVRPPAHMNCRSVMVGYIDGDAAIGERAFVSDTRTRREREIDFRAMAKESGKDIQTVRREWSAKNVGQLPSSVKYQDFLRRQTPEFQDAVLGKAKAKLFRTGKIQLTEYIDRAGNELTLAQLAAARPDVFRAARVPIPD